MLHLHYNDKFFERQNRRVNVFPNVNGVSIEDYVLIRYKYVSQSPVCFSLVEKDPYVGFCEVVYGAKLYREKIYVQKLMVIPVQNTIPLVRNCYYAYGMAAGFHTYGYTGKGCSYSGFMKGFDWMDSTFPIEKIFWDCSKVSCSDISEIEPAFKYCAYNHESNMSVSFYLRLYKCHPTTCEMLMKCGLYRFLNEKAISLLEQHKDFAFWCARNSESISDSRIAPRTAFNAWKKNPAGDPSDYAHSLACRCAVGREIAFINKKVYHKALKHATQERILRYQEEQEINSQSYEDYLVACDWLQLDFSDTKVLFPKDFRKMHDDYTNQYFEWMCEQDKLEAEKEAATLNIGMAATAKKFAFLGDFSLDGVRVLVAKSKMDLINEGARLHHCVGKMDYDKRQANGESIICMLRKSSDPLTPYVTAEVKITPERLRVVQCYGDHDKVVPEIMTFTEKWMSFCNKVYRKKGDERSA